MTQVLEQSITGVIFVMEAMGREVFANYVNNFGFGAGGIELDKEVPAMSVLLQTSDCQRVTASLPRNYCHSASASRRLIVLLTADD